MLAKVNLYKIKNYENVKEYLDNNYDYLNSKNVKIDSLYNKKSSFNFQLFFDKNDGDKNLSWNWVLKEFNEDFIKVKANPKAIILIDDDNEYYALTFGHSYYHINKHSDKNWAFDFAQRVEYDSIKSLEVNISNSKVNKRINSYVNYDNLDINSGEAFAKVDGNFVILEDLEDLLKDRINVSNSLKLTIKNGSLDAIAKVIDYINYVINNTKEINKMPRFEIIGDKDKLDELDNILLKELFHNEDNSLCFNYSYNSGISFDECSDFCYLFSNKNDKIHKNVSVIEIKEFKEFISALNVDRSNVKLDNFKIKIGDAGNFDLKDIIFFEYLGDGSNYVLFDGEWHRYNQEYLDFLNKSVNEISISEGYEEHSSFCKYIEDNNLKYNEGNFNEFLSENENYVLLDKRNENYFGHKVEIADLYKEGTIFAVKIGKPKDLSYAIDQSLMGLSIIHNNDSAKVNKENLKNVCIWFILTRKTEINSLSDINSLIFKDKLDKWKKEVRLKGYNPCVKISYKYIEV